MKQYRNRTFIAIIILFLFITGGLFLRGQMDKDVTPESDRVSENNTDDGNQSGKPSVTKKKTTANTNTLILKTNEDIKLKYGKLEEVFLYNGKKYEGAVISIDEFYTIVTINGTVKIPMNEVKLRNIIK